MQRNRRYSMLYTGTGAALANSAIDNASSVALGSSVAATVADSPDPARCALSLEREYDMANSSLPDWGCIFSEIKSRIEKSCSRPAINDAEDIANLACAIAAEKWKSEEETDWQAPGLRFTWGIAQKLILKWYRDNLRNAKPVTDLGLDDDGGDLLDNLEARTADPAVEAAKQLDGPTGPKPLIDCMNEFLDDLPKAIKAAFIAHWAFGMPIELCWEMIKHSPGCVKYCHHESSTNAWQKVFGPILRGLDGYLQIEGWLPTSQK